MSSGHKFAALEWLLAAETSAFVMTFVVMTQMSWVFERDNNLPSFVVPMALVLALLAGMRGVRDGWQLRSALSGTAFRQIAVLGPTIGLVVFSGSLGAVLANDPADAGLSFRDLLENLTIGAAVVATIRSRSALDAALWGLVAGGAAMASITTWQFLTGITGNTVWGFGGWETEVLAEAGASLRATGPFLQDPNTYGQHLVVAAGIALGYALMGSHLVSATGAFLVTSTALAQTESRSAMVAMAGVLIFVLVRIGFGWRRVAMVALGATMMLVILAPATVNRVATLADPVLGSQETAGVERSLRGRTSEMLAAARMFVDHPVAGVGYGQFNDRYLDYSRQIGLDPRFEDRSAHSLPLEIAAEQGIIGIAAWGGLATLAFSGADQLKRRKRMLPPLLVGLVGFGAVAVFLHDTRPRLMFVMLALGVAALIVDSRERRLSSDPVPKASGVRVAMVIQNYLPTVGGAERQLASLTPLLIERGITPIVITRSRPGQPRSEFLAEAEVIRVPSRGPKALQSAMFVVGTLRQLRRIGPHVIHAYDSLTPSLIAGWYHRATGTPYITKLLRSGELGDLARLEGKRLGEWRTELLLETAAGIVAISHDIDDELESRGVPWRRRLPIPNGVDTQRFRPPSNGSTTGKVVVAVGRVAAEKRIAQLADRWHLVTAKHRKTRLLVIGEGPEQDRVDAVPGVKVLGRREDVPELLRKASLYVSASAAEGLSNALLEAMATGLACVVTDVGGVRDVVEDGVNGVIVSSIDEIPQAVVELLGDRALRDELGEAARATVEDRFGLVATAEALCEVYRHVTKPRQEIP